MIRRALLVATAFALATAPLPAAQASGKGIESSPGIQFGVVVDVSCTLTLSPGGNFAFASISGLGGNAPEATAENDATASCSAPGPVRLAITDSSLTGTTTYYLSSGANKVAYEICPTSGSANACYPNATNGFAVPNGSTTKLFGYLPTQSSVKPGSYSDTVTVTVSFP